MNNYFTACANLSEAKKLYRELLKKYHPDVNSNSDAEEVTKKIVKQFDAYCLGHAGQAYDSTNRDYRAEDVADLAAMLRRVCELNCRVELTGTWIWAFESYEVRSELDKLGFHFSGKHKAWFWNGQKRKTRYRSKESIEDIKNRYGSITYREHTDKENPNALRAI